MSETVEKKGLVPKLRFPGFPGGWDNVSFGTLYEFGKSYQVSRDNLNALSGLVGVVHYGDIHTKLPSHVDFAVTNVPFLNEASDHSISPEDAVSVGDLIFADASEDLADVGKAIEVVGLAERPISAGMHTILAKRRNDRPEPGFGGFYIRSLFAQSQIRHEAQGTKVFGISGSRLARIRVLLPSDSIEQRKIAECLESLDELIAAETEKLEALKRHKKGLLQQLFPTEGETTPRLRFPQFRNTGDWRNVPLTQLCSIKTGKKDVNEGSAAGAYPFFTCAAAISRSDSFSFDSEAVLIAGNADSVGRAKYYKGKFEAYQRTYVLDTFRNVSARYAFALLDEFFQTYCQSQFQTTAMNYITLPILSNFQLPVPMSDAEQDAIAGVSFDLSATIEVMSTHLAEVRNHKAALMQQLFPSLDELESSAQ